MISFRQRPLSSGILLVRRGNSSLLSNSTSTEVRKRIYFPFQSCRYHVSVDRNLNFRTKINRIKYLSTKSPDDSETSAKTALDHQTDKDFAAYLTGKTEESNTNQYISLLDSVDNQKSSFNKSNATTEISSSQEESSKASNESDWLNFLSASADLGRPTQELDETYKNQEQNRVHSLEKIRSKRLLTVRRALAGNMLISVCKLGAFLHSGSSAMMSEFIHSIVDSGNQALLLLGLHDSGNKADRVHPYGYGKSIYFWALVSALGTFFLGAGVSMTQAIPELIHGPSIQEITWHVWGVLGFSFVVDGYVFTKTLLEVKQNIPADSNASLWKQIWNIRDPATLAILLEDGAACLGVIMAISGITLTHVFDMPVFDALAGVGISGLLAGMGIVLVRVNHRFLLGQAVDHDIIKGIEKILLNRRSIDHVYSVQSQWTGPETFSYKAEVDFDGTFLAAKLMPRYQQEFSEARATLDQDLRVLLSWYAEDVMRTVEREVRHIEVEIRKKYPGAQYIELEPMSRDADRLAIDDGMEAQLKRIEIEALNRYLKSLYQLDVSKRKPKEKNPDEIPNDNGQ